MSYIFNFGVPGLARALSVTARQRLAEAGTLVRYQNGQHIQSRGDKTRGFSIINEGAVCFGKNDAEGRFITTVVLEPGQCYGEFTLFAGLPRTHDGYAVGETAINHVSKSQFDALLLAEPELAAPIMTSLTMQLHSALEWIDDLRRYPLKVRLAKTLLHMFGQSDGGPLKVTQAQMAELMGVTRVAIAQALKFLRGKGFVKTVYGGLELANIEHFQGWLEDQQQLEQVRGYSDPV